VTPTGPLALIQKVGLNVGATDSKAPVQGTSAVTAKLQKLSVISGVKQLNVIGAKNWAAIKTSSESAIIEASTTPNNSPDEWKQIKWSGGTPVQGKLNRCTVPLSASKQIHVEATLGGVTDFVDIWVVWATVEILASDRRPGNSAPFPKGPRESDKLGVVTYGAGTSSVIDEANGVFVDNMATAGKIVAVGHLKPDGVNKVIREGWKLEREAFSKIWWDGNLDEKQSNTIFTRDTSNIIYLRLVPDALDQIYDSDAPDSKTSVNSFERYDNFRQWVEWNGVKCSDYAFWSWQAIWHVNKDPNKQIELQKLLKRNIDLPTKPKYPPPPPPK